MMATRGFVAFAGRGGAAAVAAVAAAAAAVAARRRHRRGTRRVRVQGGQPAARDLEVLLEPYCFELSGPWAKRKSRCAF